MKGNRKQAKKMRTMTFALILIMSSMGFLTLFSGFASAGPIVNITVTGQNSGTDVENGEPGDDILFDILVENNGDAVATVNLTTAGEGSWEVQLLGPDFTLNAGQSTTITLTVSIPSDAVETDFRAITIKDTTSSKQDSCRVNVDQLFALNFEVPEGEEVIKETAPDNTVGFTLKINNSGNGVDTTSFTDTGAPPTWSVSFDSTKNIPARTSADFIVSVYVPPNYARGTYNIQLRATSEDTITYATKTVTVNVQAKYGLTVSPLPSSSESVLPGGKVSYNLEIENVGNTDDRFGLKIDVANKTADWTATLGLATTPNVISGAKTSVTLQITAPLGAKNTDLGYINITVTSINDGTQKETAYTVTGIVQEFYISITPDNSAVAADQNSVAEFTYTIKNSGNGQDRIDITAVQPAGWNSPNISPNYFTLAPNAQDTFTVRQTVPADALNKGYNFEVKAKSRDSETAVSTSVVTVDVNQVFDLLVGVPGSAIKKQTPGNPVTFTIDVENLGNGRDTFRLSVVEDDVPEGWSTEFSDTGITLDANEKTNVTLTITIPADYAQHGPKKLSINVTSDGDNSIYDDTSSVTVDVEKTYGVVLSTTDSSNEGYPKDEVFYRVSMKNTGTAQDIIEILIDDGPYKTWASLNESLFTVEPQETKYVNLTVKIPDEQPAGSGHYVNLTAKSTKAEEKGIEKTDSITTETLVKPDYEVFLFAIGGNTSSADPGEAITFLVGVQNRGIATDTFDIEFTGDDPFNKFVVVDAENFTVVNLAKNDIKQIAFRVEMPIDVHDRYPGITTGDIHVKATSRKDSAQSMNINFQAEVLAKYDGSLSTSNNFNETKPGMTATYTLELENTGSSDDKYLIEVTDCPFDDVTFTPTNKYAIASGDRIEFNVTIMVDDDTKKDNYYFNVTAKSGGLDGQVTPSDDIITVIELKLEVLQIYDVRVTCNVNTMEVKPGEDAEYEINIENKGNGQDEFDITKYSPNATFMGWTSFNKSALILESEERVSITMTISIPDRERPNNDVKVYCNVSSRGDPDDNTKDSVFTITTIEQKFKLELSSTAISKEIDPGKSAIYTIKVKNAGTGDDQVEVLIVSSDQSSWATITSDLIFDIGPNEIKLSTVEVEVPENQENKAYDIVFRAVSQNAVNPEVKESINLSVNVNPKRDLELSSTEKTKEVTPKLTSEVTITFKVTLLNKGTAQDSFDLKIDRVNSDFPNWVTLSTLRINVGADSTDDFNVNIKIPKGRAPTDDTGFKTSIIATSPGESSGPEDDFTDLIELFTVIEQAYGVKIEEDEKLLETDDLPDINSKERKVTFNFNLENTGTGEDTYKVEIPNPPSGWTDTNFRINPSSVLTLVQGAKQEVSIEVTINRDDPVGEKTFRVKATSRGDDTAYDTADAFEEKDFTVKITSIHDFRFTIVENNKDGNPGETITYTLTLKNKGNDRETITLQQPESPEWGTITISPLNVELGPKGDADEGADITVSVKISTDYVEAKAGDYNFTLVAEASDEVTQKEVKILANVDQKYAFEINSNDWEKEDSVESDASEDKEVEYIFTIKNKGNGRDTFKIELTGDYTDWATLSTRYSDYLEEYDDEQEITCTITIKRDFEKAEAGDYEIGLTVTSQGDGEVFNQDNTFKLTIEKVYDIELNGVEGNLREGHGNIVGEGEITLSPAEEQDGLFQLDIKNNGNDEDTVSIKVSKKPSLDWDITLVSSKKINRGQTQTLDITITPPEDVTEEDSPYTIKISVTSQDGSSKVEYEIEVTIELPILEFLEITTDLTGKDLKEGEETIILIKVINTGQADAEDIQINIQDTFDGKTKNLGSYTIDKLAAGKEDTFEFEDWKVDDIKEGKHKIKVSLDQPVSGDVVEKEQNIKVEEDEDTEEKGRVIPIMSNQNAIISLGALCGILLLLFIIAAAKARSKPSIPEDLKEEIARARAMQNEPSSKMLPSGDMGKKLALPESTEKKEVDEGPREKKAKPVKIKCPKCTTIQAVTTAKRPIEFDCSNCGMKLILKK